MRNISTFSDVVDSAWSDKYPSVPVPVIGCIENMMKEHNWDVRDNYRSRLENIIECAQYALKVETDDRSKKKAAARLRRKDKDAKEN